MRLFFGAEKDTHQVLINKKNGLILKKRGTSVTFHVPALKSQKIDCVHVQNLNLNADLRRVRKAYLVDLTRVTKRQTPALSENTKICI